MSVCILAQHIGVHIVIVVEQSILHNNMHFRAQLSAQYFVLEHLSWRLSVCIIGASALCLQATNYEEKRRHEEQMSQQQKLIDYLQAQVPAAAPRDQPRKTLNVNFGKLLRSVSPPFHRSAATLSRSNASTVRLCDLFLHCLSLSAYCLVYCLLQGWPELSTDM